MQAMDVNLWGAVGLTKAILPSMVDRQEGHVVVIAGAGAGEVTDMGSSHEYLFCFVFLISIFCCWYVFL